MRQGVFEKSLTSDGTEESVAGAEFWKDRIGKVLFEGSEGRLCGCLDGCQLMFSFAEHDLLRFRVALCVVLNNHQSFDVSQDDIIPGSGIGTIMVPNAAVEDNIAELVCDMLYALHVKCNIE